MLIFPHSGVLAESCTLFFDKVILTFKKWQYFSEFFMILLHFIFSYNTCWSYTLFSTEMQALMYLSSPFICQWEKKMTGSPAFFFAVGIRVQNPGSKRRYHRYLFFLDVAWEQILTCIHYCQIFNSNKWKLFLGGNHSYSNITFNFLKSNCPGKASLCCNWSEFIPSVILNCLWIKNLRISNPDWITVVASFIYFYTY